jgi:hypothetical protein
MNPQRLRRTALAAALVLAPLTGVVAAVAHPALKATTADQIAAIAAHPDRFYVYALFILLSEYLLVPALFGVMALLRERVPRWTFVAGAVAQTGLLVAIGDAATELVSWQMGAPGADRAQMVALSERYEGAPGASLIYTVGGLATLIGIALITVALWHTRVAPRWTAVALLVASMANVVGFSMGSQPVLVGSFVLLLAAFTPMALRLIGVATATTEGAPGTSRTSVPVR